MEYQELVDARDKLENGLVKGEEAYLNLEALGKIVVHLADREISRLDDLRDE